MAEGDGKLVNPNPRRNIKAKYLQEFTVYLFLCIDVLGSWQRVSD